jgi:hypothetical protein
LKQYQKLPDIQLPPQVQLLKPFTVRLNKLNKNFLQILDEMNASSSFAPLTFEALNTAYGYVSYSTIVTFLAPNPAVLEIPGLADRAYIYVNDVRIHLNFFFFWRQSFTNQSRFDLTSLQTFQGILSRTERNLALPMSTKPGSSLRIVVENQGRIGYGSLTGETKGIVGNVTFAGNKLSNWQQTSTRNWTEIVTEIEQLPIRTRTETMIDFGKPKLYRSEFVLKETAADTLLDPTDWGKGVVFINGHNIGRYWPASGPQITLFVPGVWLNEAPKNNTLIIINFENDPCIGRNGCEIGFTDKHILNAPTPYK